MDGKTHCRNDTPAEIHFDWDAEVKDNYATFKAQIDRDDRHSAFDARIDLSRLKEPHLKALQSVLARRHEDLSQAPEMATTIRWLLGIALAQQGLGPEERDARIRELMLCAPEPLLASPKESLFEMRGLNFLRESGLKDFHEQTKALRGYSEVRRSWQQAVRAFTFNIGTPKLKADSPEEQDELELFFLRLRYESISTAVTAHTSLVDKWDSNPLFRAAVAEVIRPPLAPDQKGMSLEYYILCSWLTSCLWLLNNKDRATLLNRVYGITLVADDGVRKAIDRLGGLKDWNDFQPKGTKAPYRVRLWTEDGQEWCQIVSNKVTD